MTRVLIVETAAPGRVRKTAEEILAGRSHETSEVTILCSADSETVEYLSKVDGASIVPLRKGAVRSTLDEIRRQRFEVVRIFWTGEKKYRRMKLLSLLTRGRQFIVDGGDGNIFRLTWKALIRFTLFRLRHPLPTDHSEFVPQQDGRSGRGEKILVVQSAPPIQVLRALDLLSERQIFREARYTVFCRNLRPAVERFRAHPLVQEVRVHDEARDSWKHLKALRRERFDTVVVFFTGDPSFWKIKYFAFLLGARHKLIFNEQNDCFFFSVGEWLSLMAHRVGEKSGGGPDWFRRLRILLFLLLKLAVFPFRFAWLLLVWLRLRSAS